MLLRGAESGLAAAVRWLGTRAVSPCSINACCAGVIRMASRRERRFVIGRTCRARRHGRSWPGEKPCGRAVRRRAASRPPAPASLDGSRSTPPRRSRSLRYYRRSGPRNASWSLLFLLRFLPGTWVPLSNPPVVAGKKDRTSPKALVAGLLRWCAPCPAATKGRSPALISPISHRRNRARSLISTGKCQPRAEHDERRVLRSFTPPYSGALFQISATHRHLPSASRRHTVTPFAEIVWIVPLQSGNV